jgi:hypothetical protein
VDLPERLERRHVGEGGEPFRVAETWQPPPEPAAERATVGEESERVWPVRLLVAGAALVAIAAAVTIALLLARRTGTPTEPAPPAFTPTAVAARPTRAATEPAATRVERVDWVVEEGRTVVTLELDGAVTPAAVRDSRLEEPPRLVIQLLGLASAYPRYEQEAGGPHLRRVRAWYHGELQPAAQHVVLDLASPAVVASPPQVEGRRVRFTLGSAP